MKSVSDGYLMQWWRKAVLANWDYHCAFCSQNDQSQIECHHIVRRRHKALRWDSKNGIAVCFAHHHFAHTKAGELAIMEKVGKVTYDFLVQAEFKNKIFKIYLQENMLTENEFREKRLESLKAEVSAAQTRNGTSQQY